MHWWRNASDLAVSTRGTSGRRRRRQPTRSRPLRVEHNAQRDESVMGLWRSNTGEMTRHLQPSHDPEGTTFARDHLLLPDVGRRLCFYIEQ